MENKPWAKEPYFMQWIDHTTGLQCMVSRSIQLGTLCGYVAVKSGHPLYETEKLARQLHLIQTDHKVYEILKKNGVL